MEFLNSEENTNKSINLNNSKVRIIKKNSIKNNKINQEKKIINKNKNQSIEVRNNFTEICCSEKINEKCLIFWT